MDFTMYVSLIVVQIHNDIGMDVKTNQEGDELIGISSQVAKMPLQEVRTEDESAFASSS
jgi:hypothetical protein